MLKEKFERYEKHISSIGLIGGFILDNLTLRRIDLFFENLVFLIYIGICAISITFLSFHEAGRLQGRWAEKLNTPFLLLLQFAFGGLFSGFFIFYSRSATLAASWPFLLVLLGLLIGNELLKKRYLVLAFRISVFFVTIFSFAIFYVPIIAKEISPQMFLLSGGISIIVIALFIGFLSTVLREKITASKNMLLWSIGAIYLAINAMYFTNILPPIPLSLKSAGVYHDVHKAGGGYVGIRESDRDWYDFLIRYKKIHVLTDAPVFAYSSIFAPTNISTTVVHEWQYRDEARDEWKTISRIPFPITGGRDGGYRGFSYKLHTQPGRWRVNIETERGQLIGRLKFEIIRVPVNPALETKTL